MSSLGSAFHGSTTINGPFIPNLRGPSMREDFGTSTTVTRIGPIGPFSFCQDCQKVHLVMVSPCGTISLDKAARLGAYFDIKDDSQF